MSRILEILRELSFKRWQALSGFTLVLLFLLIKMLVIPMVSTQIISGSNIVKKLQFLKSSTSLDTKIHFLKKKSAKVDSLISMSDNRIIFSEPIIIEKIYMLADKVGCVIGKVQIDEPVKFGIGFEIPVFLKYSGAYSDIGRFIDGLENARHAIRIRQMNMKNIGRGKVKVTLEFIIMENAGVK